MGIFMYPLYLLSFFKIFKARRKNQLLSKRYLAIKVLAVILGFVSLLVSAFHLHLIMTTNPNKGYANGIVFYSLLMISPYYLCALIFLFIKTRKQVHTVTTEQA